MFICTLLNSYYEENGKDPTFHWQQLVGYRELVNFLIYQVHREKSFQTLENKNVLRALIPAMNNSFYVNLILPLLTTKVDLEDTNDVNQFFEIFALTCERFSQKKDFFRMNIEQNSLSKVVLYLLESDNMQNKEKCLFFLYKYFNFLGSYARDLWTEYFSKQSFFSLFLHWSRFIRKIFYNLLVYHYHKEPTI